MFVYCIPCYYYCCLLALYINLCFNLFSCRWLLDIIVKNYAVLTSRVKQAQNCQHKSVQRTQSVASNASSKVSIHSNPFKPIKDLLMVRRAINVNYTIALCLLS